MTNFYSGGHRGDTRDLLEPPLRQNYSIFMGNFQKNPDKISNNQVQLPNRTPFVNLNPLSRNPGSAPTTTICFILS